MGMSMIDVNIRATVVNPGRGAILETANGGQSRWPGDTDGVTTRDYLVVPYRMHDGTAFSQYDGARDFIQKTMDQVSNEYMGACIKQSCKNNFQEIMQKFATKL